MAEMNELFYRDPYCREFEAKVVSCEEGKKGFEVVLEDTAFYPEGGGQLADRGKLGDAAVTDVRRAGGVIVHYTDKALEPGSVVKGVLDWDRRFDNMQNHTGEHMFSGLVHQKFKYENVGFHMDEAVITCDFSGPLADEEIAALEKATNDAIAANVPVNILFPSAEELAAMDYRSKKELTGKVRIVDIPGVDRCACCGTHVKTTGEVGMLKVLSAAKHRGGVRIEFVCGARALRDYGAKTAQAAEISALLSAKPNEIAAGVRKVLQEVLDRDQKIAELNSRYFAMKAKTFPDVGRLLVSFEEGLSPFELKKFCSELAEEKKYEAIAVFSPAPGSTAEAPAYSYVIHCGKPELRDISKKLNKDLNGRGGGNNGFVQGSYRAAEAAIREALEAAF